jgi:hypothetical protein
MAFGLGWARPSRLRKIGEQRFLGRCDRGRLIARVEAGETLPRQDAPAPLVRRHIPANVAVAVLPLLNDAKSVAEKVQVGRVAWKSRVDDVDGIGVDIVLQTRPRFLPGAAAQCQKCQDRCSCAAHGSASPTWSRLVVCFSADPGAAEAPPARRPAHARSRLHIPFDWTVRAWTFFRRGASLSRDCVCHGQLFWLEHLTRLTLDAGPD